LITDKPPLNWFTLTQLQREALEANSRQVKRALIKRGLVNQISFYGNIASKSTEPGEARRFEIFSATPYTEDQIILIKAVIKEIKPPWSYSIWEYDAAKQAMRVIAHYDRRTY
jgi:hypothetical protein